MADPAQIETCPDRLPREYSINASILTDRWRKIAIALIDNQKGETKAQACADAG
jgi:hypothetical protein